MAAWPGNFPQKPRWTDFTRTYKESRSIYDPSAGPTVVRGRTTTDLRRETWGFEFDFSLLDDWETFWATTIARGALPIDIDDPFNDTPTQVAVTVVSLPRVRAIAGQSFIVQMDVEYIGS